MSSAMKPAVAGPAAGECSHCGGSLKGISTYTVSAFIHDAGALPNDGCWFMMGRVRAW